MNTEHKKPVTSKRDFVRRYKLGEFGNASPTWNSLQDWIDDYWREYSNSLSALFHIRNRVAGGLTWYDVPGKELIQRWQAVLCSGVNPTSLYISAMSPTEKTILQGEVRRSERGLELTYTRVKKPMRDALAEETLTAFGIRAKCTCEQAMDSNSWNWLNELLDNYPDHVIEFSVYSEPWGTIPGYNTVFWEVRKY